MISSSRSSPYVFDEFFASGKEESISPFLTPSSKRWGKNLPLKSALFSALFLAGAFFFHFFSTSIASSLLLVVYVLSGTPALINALEDLRNLEINIDVLMTLAALLSVLIGSGFEGALLLVLFELSAAMEKNVTQKTNSALVSLHRLCPTKAYLVTKDGHLLEKAIQEILPGDHILIKAGEIVPLDGTILEGSSFINLSHLTGESIPIAKTPGQTVPSGARNLDGTFTLSVTACSKDSTLSRIIHLIAQAQEEKPKIQKWIDRLDKKYATSIILLTLFFALSLPFLFALPFLGSEGSIYRALTFLIAASPCALIIATPTAYLSSISSCAKRGILLKGGAILDAIASCHHIAFDKTGTLTTGALSCQKIAPLNPEAQEIDPLWALAIAASLEKHVHHPIGQAILQLAKEKALSLPPLTQFTSVPGFGIEALLDEHPCYLGNESFIRSKQELSLPFPKEEESQTFLLFQGALFAFYFQDEVRPGADLLIQRLQKDLSLQVVMLTGDLPENAEPIAKQLHIHSVFAGLKPEGKLDKVSLLSQKKGLIMVGDGVNDAPALARASVGISLGNIGSTSAIDASDVVLLQDDLISLDWLIKKSKKTLRIIKQNLFLALLVILFATTPALLGLVPLWLAVLLHEGGTVLVGLNSLRLLKQ